MRKTKTVIKFHHVNGLKQIPKELDFCITPVLKFAQSDDNHVGDIGYAHGLFIEWGYWAIGIAIFTAYLN